MPRKTIILMEDDEILREFYSSALELHNYLVVQVGNSRDILELIEKHRPDLVITDLVMPDHEGMEGIFTILRHHSIPIIAISSYEKYLALARPVVVSTLSKPISGPALVAAVDKVLRPKAPAA